VEVLIRVKDGWINDLVEDCVKALDDKKGTKRILRSTLLDYMGTLVGNELNGLRGEKYYTPSMLSIKIKAITSSC